MESPVVFSDTVSPVCLPTTSDDYTMKDAVVMGWGTIKEGSDFNGLHFFIRCACNQPGSCCSLSAIGGGQPTSLQQVTVKVQENSLCKQKYQKDSPGTIIPSMLCAAYPGKDSCQVWTCFKGGGGDRAPFKTVVRSPFFYYAGRQRWSAGLPRIA